MAGVAPQRGSNATTIGMVVSIVVAVLLLAALVWLFTQQEQLKRSAEQATAARSSLASGGDESTARQMFPDAGGAKTLVGEMNKGMQMLVGGLTGSAQDSPKAAMEKLDAALNDIAESGKVPNAEEMTKAQGAVAIIEGLHDAFKTEREAREKATAELNKAIEQLTAAAEEKTKLTERYKSDYDKLKAQVDLIQAAKDEFERTKSGDIEALTQQIGAKQEQLDSMRRDRSKLLSTVQGEIAERDRLLFEQRNALKELRGPAAQGAQPLAIARKPIGTVLRALPGDSLVHIDLGKSDNVTLGMTFTVYSATEQVQTDGRGKAKIEVVSLGQRTAECRVTMPPSPDDPILESDRVGNIVLSKNRAKKQQFCIVGDFDVDYDGQVDVRGREVIKSLVERYGGEVVPTVTATTDYVVVGVEPGGAAAAERVLPSAEEEPAAEAAEPEEEAAEEEAAAEEEPAAEETEAAEEEGEAEEETEAKEEEDEEDEEEEAEAGEGEEEEPETGKETEEKAEEEESTEEGEEEAEEEAAEEKPEDEVEEEGAEAEEEEAEGEEEGEGAEVAEEEESETEEAKAEPAAADAKEESALEQLPRLKRAAEVDPTDVPRARKAMTEQERYDEALRRAQMFSIPVLPRDPFLHFVGIEPGPGAARRLLQQ